MHRLKRVAAWVTRPVPVNANVVTACTLRGIASGSRNDLIVGWDIKAYSLTGLKSGRLLQVLLAIDLDQKTQYVV